MADQSLAQTTLFNLGNEANRSKISFWMTTAPGQTSDVNLVYTQNAKADLNQEIFYYNLYVQKQIGSAIDDFELQINYPEKFIPVNVTNYDQTNRLIIIKDKIDQDKIYKIKFIRS
jgi:hypothetical protein